MARSMLSAGMLFWRAVVTAVRSRGFALMSPPPRRAATVISLMNLVNCLPRRASLSAFLCLIELHLEWPDMARPAVTTSPTASKSRKPRRTRYCARGPGVDTWYGPGFHGNRTANGEIYDQYELTAAHPSLPLGTRVMVKNLENGRAVQVRVNDRGPFVDGRAIDLSYAAARTISMVGPGTVRVRIEVLGPTTLAAAAPVAAPAALPTARPIPRPPRDVPTD